jgi:hypothetical protein
MLTGSDPLAVLPVAKPLAASPQSNPRAGNTALRFLALRMTFWRLFSSLLGKWPITLFRA